MALYATIYLAVMGADGLRRINEESYAGAHWLMEQLTATGKLTPAYPDSPVLNEFVMTSRVDIDELIARCIAEGILPGVKIAPDRILIAVTEMQSRADMERLVKIVDAL